MSREKLAERFGENLKHYRKKAGLSQEELASMTEVHRTQVSQLERAKHLPRLDTFVKLVGALGIPPEDLLEGLAFEPSVRQRGKFKISESEGEE
ncbi:MAG: helix-turn-helix transcriptional regulator [Solirubrobacterales bacterium]